MRRRHLGMKATAVSLLFLVLLALACSRLSLDGQLLRPAEATGTALAAATRLAPTASLDVTAAIARAVRLTLTAVAPSATHTPPSSPTAEFTSTTPPTATPLPTETPAPTETPRPTASPQLTSSPDRPATGNLALNQSTRASHSLQSPAGMAVDGNKVNGWGSGDYPPQWIEIDLGAPATVTSIRLLATQYPYGDTVHRILVGGPQGALSEVFRFEQYTHTGQWLTFTPETPLDQIQIVRIETVSSPSWVGWLEIEVLGQR